MKVPIGTCKCTNAGLQPHHVAAIRLCTTNLYCLFNNPMCAREKPYPIKTTVFFLLRGAEEAAQGRRQAECRGAQPGAPPLAGPEEHNLRPCGHEESRRDRSTDQGFKVYFLVRWGKTIMNEKLMVCLFRPHLCERVASPSLCRFMSMLRHRRGVRHRNSRGVRRQVRSFGRNFLRSFSFSGWFPLIAVDHSANHHDH